MNSSPALNRYVSRGACECVSNVFGKTCISRSRWQTTSGIAAHEELVASVATNITSHRCKFDIAVSCCLTGIGTCHALVYAANSLDTCTGCQSIRPRGVLTPRACRVRAIPVNVSIPLACISRTTASVVAFALTA